MARCLAVVFLLLLACHGSSPTDPTASLQHGRLSGIVTIGPNCPVEQKDNPCPTPPSAYAARKVLVYDEARTRLLFTVDIDSHGLYVIDLVPNRYTVDLQKQGLDRAAEVPAKVDIRANDVTRLDINIDTGLR